MNHMNPSYVRNVAFAGMGGYLYGETTWCLIAMMTMMVILGIISIIQER